MSNTELQQSFQHLVDIVAELREKCPWDRVQTKESLRHLTIEETYELVDAILKNDEQEIKIELGDLLLHVLFYARLGEESGTFDLNGVIRTQAEKLIRRHPHIYGDVQADTPEQVVVNWEQIKSKEKSHKKKSTLSGVPDSLPSLIKALRMQEKAASAGFDFENSTQVWDKVKEEIAEFEGAANAADKEAEMGDLLFALVNYCRFAGINPDDALSKTNLKFKQRFEFIESAAAQAEKNLREMSLDEMEVHWQEAKAQGL